MINGMRLPLTILMILRICYATPIDDLMINVDQTIQQTEPLNKSLIPAISNASYSGDFPNIKCDGKSYGSDPDIADCMTAIQYFLPSRAQTTYAQRGTPAEKGDAFPLPLRIMGGMDCSTLVDPRHSSPSCQSTQKYAILTLVVDRALCYFQPILSNTAQTGHLSLNEMRDAAVTLLRQCGAAKSEGGLAMNIGKLPQQACKIDRPREHGLIIFEAATATWP